jgi:hypothetical protein
MCLGQLANAVGSVKQTLEQAWIQEALYSRNTLLFIVRD